MLRPVEFYVLLALGEGPQHGYALVRRIEEQSDGRLQILPGNLYAVIRRLEGDGLLRKSTKYPSANEDQRRRYFELTRRGRDRLRDEARHMERLLAKLGAFSLKPANRGGDS